MIVRARELALWCGILVLGSGCVAPAISQGLSEAEAIRIADAEARKAYQLPLAQYEHWPVHRYASEGRWYIGYRQPGKKFVDFGIDVYDKTRKASILIAN
jgi:hypothetical protein